MSQYRVLKGRLGEDVSAEYLEKQGYRILERNWRSGRSGEIDIIATTNDGNTLVFAEVKTRSSSDYGHPLEAVTPQKQQQIATVAETYLQEKLPTFDNIRFDILSVLQPSPTDVPQVEHFINAFSR